MVSTIFLDENHNFVSENDAIWKIIHEYDENGKLIKEIWVDLTQEED